MDPLPPVVADDGGSVWDWGNLLDFHITDEEDLVLLSSSRSSDPAPSPSPASALEPEHAAAAAASTTGSRSRKRDPMLVCPNYLAGRVPCACPEVDEMIAAEAAEANPTKRARNRSSAGVFEIRCQVFGCEADIRELKGYHRRHRVCLRCANAASVMLDGVGKRYCQQCGKFHILSDFDEGKRSCRRKLEKHNRRRRRRPVSGETSAKDLEDQSDSLAAINYHSESLEGFSVVSESEKTKVSNKSSDGNTPIGSEDGQGSLTSTLPPLLSKQNDDNPSFATSAETTTDDVVDNIKNQMVPASFSWKNAYLSSCPTGRMSFKLFDWNPAEFPRRLRLQIMEWLANMPVELEGYIRPGCTILTVFIAMPQSMWDKLYFNAPKLLKELVSAPDCILNGKGTFFVNLNNMIFQILEDGTPLMNGRMEVRVPKIHYVHPTCFEAGKQIEFVVCGSYLDLPQFRSLVSFDGKYLKHTCHHLESEETVSYVNGASKLKHEMFRITIGPSKEIIHGPAFFEVENVAGLSNFVPLLFGSKQICSELEKIQEILSKTSCGHDSYFDVISGARSNACELFGARQNVVSDLLLDIAWTIKKTRIDGQKKVLSPSNVKRLSYLFKFLVENKFLAVLEMIVQSLDGALGEVLSHSMVDGQRNVDVTHCIDSIMLPRSYGTKSVIVDTEEGSESNRRFAGDTAVVTLGISSDFYSLAPVEYTTKNEVACFADEASTLLPENVLQSRQCCNPHSSIRWYSLSHRISFHDTSARRWITAALMVGVVVCLAACAIFIHPHKANIPAYPVQRNLFDGSQP